MPRREYVNRSTAAIWPFRKSPKPVQWPRPPSKFAHRIRPNEPTGTIRPAPGQGRPPWLVGQEDIPPPKCLRESNAPPSGGKIRTGRHRPAPAPDGCSYSLTFLDPCLTVLCPASIIHTPGLSFSRMKKSPKQNTRLLNSNDFIRSQRYYYYVVVQQDICGWFFVHEAMLAGPDPAYFYDLDCGCFLQRREVS